MWVEKSEKSEIFHKITLEKQKKEILEIYFYSAKNDLIKELEDNEDSSVEIKLYIVKLKSLNSNIIKFKTDNPENRLIETNSNNGEKSNISIYINKLGFSTNFWIQMSLYHELRHYVWLDLYKKNINILNNIKGINFKEKEFTTELIKKREINTKITTFRYFMKKHNIKINESWINQAFSFYLNKIDKWDYLSLNEKKEIFFIYNNFKDNKENLLLYLQNLVKLEELKKETQNT